LLISAVAVLIGLIFLLVNGLDVFMQYRLYILSKPLTYVVITVMVLCIILTYVSRGESRKISDGYTLHCPLSISLYS
jgi:hypothetical protein